MGDRDRRPDSTRVYVGGLTDRVKKEDLESEFEKYGKLNSVWVAFNPPGFAFIEFINLQDAETACDNLNGTEFLGTKLRVELAKGRSRRGGSRGGGRGRGGPYRPGGGSRDFRDGGGFRGSRGGSGGGRFGGPRRDSGGFRGGRREFERRSDGYRGGRSEYNGDGGGRGPRLNSSSRFRSRSPAGGGPRR